MAEYDLAFTQFSISHYICEGLCPEWASQMLHPVLRGLLEIHSPGASKGFALHWAPHRSTRYGICHCGVGEKEGKGMPQFWGV